MKKGIAISLLVVFLGTNTELHQLFRFPILFHHFLEHLDEGPDETFSDFLKAHYSATIEHADSDHQDHENLPFKTKDCATMHTSVALNNHYNFTFCEPNNVSEKMLIAFNAVIYSFAIQNYIWQPPQFS